MFSQITLADFRRYNCYGLVREECFDCNDAFTPESKIFNPDESPIFLCARCYEELLYT